jgi:hypothetical protein
LKPSVCFTSFSGKFALQRLHFGARDDYVFGSKHDAKLFILDTPIDGMFTSFMVNKVRMSSIDAVKDHTANQSGLLLKTLKKELFANLQNDPRMIKLIERLKPIAVM